MMAATNDAAAEQLEYVDDLTLVATLKVAGGIAPDRVVVRTYGKATFVYAARPELDRIRRAFYASEVSVEPVRFLREFRAARTAADGAVGRDHRVMRTLR